jgi:hypothetical protein
MGSFGCKCKLTICIRNARAVRARFRSRFAQYRRNFGTEFRTKLPPEFRESPNQSPNREYLGCLRLGLTRIIRARIIQTDENHPGQESSEGIIRSSGPDGVTPLPHDRGVYALRPSRGFGCQSSEADAWDIAAAIASTKGTVAPNLINGIFGRQNPVSKPAKDIETQETQRRLRTDEITPETPDALIMWGNFVCPESPGKTIVKTGLPGIPRQFRCVLELCNGIQSFECGVNAFARLQIVRGWDSSYFGSK